MKRQNSINTKYIALFLCLLSVLDVLGQLYGDLEYPTAREQKAQLDKVAKGIWRMLPAGAQGRRTIAVMQIPGTQHFVISSSNTTIDKSIWQKGAQVQDTLSKYGFELSETLTFITKIGKPVENLKSQQNDAGLLNDYEYYGVPLTERQTAASGNHGLAIHAEMALISYLATYTNFNPSHPDNDISKIVFGVDKGYCGRCASFMHHMGIHTLDSDQINSVTVKIPTNTANNWSMPIYNKSNSAITTSAFAAVPVPNPGPVWPLWLRQTAANYLHDGWFWYGNPNGTGRVNVPNNFVKVPRLPAYLAEPVFDQDGDGEADNAG